MPWAVGQSRRVALVGGEAGSGKSRLVREFAARRRRGRRARPLRRLRRGRARALRRVRRGARRARPRHRPGRVAPRSARPASWRGWCPPRGPDGEPAARRADPDTDRHRLHTAVTDLLAGVSAGRPVLLVLEDVHWADGPTLGLLRHLARASGRARLLLLATFRDAEAAGRAVGDARRPAPLRGRRAAAAVRPVGRRRDRVRPPAPPAATARTWPSLRTRSAT